MYKNVFRMEISLFVLVEHQRRHSQARMIVMGFNSHHPVNLMFLWMKFRVGAVAARIQIIFGHHLQVVQLVIKLRFLCLRCLTCLLRMLRGISSVVLMIKFKIVKPSKKQTSQNMILKNKPKFNDFPLTNNNTHP